ncbi:MAG TPA: carbohydrate kinase family protein [Trebonia sp.]|jgi:sugar/nucleoside kinase (ribokinase family)
MSGRAVVIGSVALDLVAPSRGAASAAASAGNSGSNIAIRLAAAGWQVTFVTVVGPDQAGTLVRADCERWGVDTSGFTVDQDYPTPRVFVVSDGSGQSELLFRCPGCDRERGRPLRVPRPDQLGRRSLDAAAAADLVIADIPGPAVAQLAAASSSGLVWYEASMFEAAASDQRQLADVADVLKCSREELPHYAGLFADPPPRTRAAVITAGAAGTDAELLGGAGRARLSLHVGACPADVVDPLGAGDAFTATAAARLAAAHRARPDFTAAELETALAAGSAAAAKACGATGARGDMTSGASRAIVNPWIATDLPFLCPLCAP